VGLTGFTLAGMAALPVGASTVFWANAFLDQIYHRMCRRLLRQ
jgi:hypothetical protein